MSNDHDQNSGKGTPARLVALFFAASMVVGCIVGLLVYHLAFPSDSGSETTVTTQKAAAKTSTAASAPSVPATTTAAAEPTETASQEPMDINKMFDEAAETDLEGEEADQPGDEEESSGDGDYILPGSSDRELTEADLDGLSSRDLQLARNEIYARHGRRFNTDWIQDYFNGKDWYEPAYSPEEFDRNEESMLSSLEERNIHFIQEHE